MANIIVTNGARFQPFSYQELTAPLDRMEAYHEKLAEEYDNLSKQADVLEAMGNNDRDKKSGEYAQYKSYSDALRKEADNLYQHGLNTESRMRLSELRRRYNTDIVPIQNAWNKREEEVREQMKAQLAHPGMRIRFTRNASDTALGYYRNNPQGGYGIVNLDAITSQMSAMAKNLSKLQGEGKLQNVDEFTKRLITPYGLDPNLITIWQQDPSRSPILTDMMNQVLTSNGVNTEEFLNNPNGQSILQEAVRAAQQGAWDAVGEDKEHWFDDKRAVANLEAANQIGVYKAKKAIDTAEASSNAAQARGTMDESIYELPMQAADGKNPAQKVNVRALNYEKTDWNPTSKNYTVREITKYKDGKPVYDTKTMSLGELLNKKDSSKNNLDISTYWSDTKGHEGLILATTEDGKAHRYFISADSMPESNVQDARQYFALANQYKQQGKNEEAKAATEIAYKALHTGLTIHNKAYDQSMIRQPSLKQEGLAD